MLKYPQDKVVVLAGNGGDSQPYLTPGAVNECHCGIRTIQQVFKKKLKAFLAPV